MALSGSWGKGPVRLSQRVRLLDGLPDQCGNRDAGVRAYPLAGPSVDERDREGLNGAPADGPDLPRPVRSRERSGRKLLPDLEPNDLEPGRGGVTGPVASDGGPRH